MTASLTDAQIACLRKLCEAHKQVLTSDEIKALSDVAYEALPRLLDELDRLKRQADTDARTISMMAEAHDRRVADLLEANNREVERRRELESELHIERTAIAGPSDLVSARRMIKRMQCEHADMALEISFLKAREQARLSARVIEARLPKP